MTPPESPPLSVMDLTLASLDENLALDEALLLQAEEGGPELLRFWEWPSYAVVLGANGQIAVDVNELACQDDGIPLGRRSSGGGTVLLGPGCLLYSLVLRFDRAPALKDVNASYRWIAERMAAALAPFADAAVVGAGTSDLAIAQQKFSGNAQHRKQRCLLHHGTLLYDFDLDTIAHYLRMPQRQPDYRAGRAHRQFLRNLHTSAVDLQASLASAWQATIPLREWPRERVHQLVAEKYAQADWIRRR